MKYRSATAPSPLDIAIIAIALVLFVALCVLAAQEIQAYADALSAGMGIGGVP